MTRLPLTFECQRHICAATLDNAPGSVGLLMVSGGNEIRAGAFNGQARLAAEIAAAGFPVFRFDRRGIGDSEGENRGFRKSREDIEAALLTFRALVPQMDRVIGFGNCDGASALVLTGGAGCDGLVLSNPWTIEEDADDLPSASTIRSRYAEKLTNPRDLARLATGKVHLGKLARGLIRASTPDAGSSPLAEEMRQGIADFVGPVLFLIAEHDRTGQAFLENWDSSDTRISRCPGATHAYVEPEAREWLRERLIETLRN